VVLGITANQEGTLALAALLAARLENQSIRFEVRPALDVISVVGAIQSASTVEHIVKALDECLRAEVRGSELSSPAFVTQLKRLSYLDRAREVALDRRGCLDETEAANPVAFVGNMDSVKLLERHRRSAFTEQNARWGVVGSEAIVGAVLKALENVPVWPTDRVAVGQWPKKNSATFVKASPNRLSLVVRTSDAERAFAVSRELNGEQGETAEILAGRFTGLHITLARPTAMNHGGCLRVDFDATQQQDPVTYAEFLGAARVITGAVRDWAPRRDATRHAMVLAALEQPDPVWASQLAAEVSLSKSESTQNDHFFLQLQTAETPPQTPEKLLEEVLSAASHSPLEVLTRIEAGQGKMYALLASPCVPALESKRLVGSSALFLSAMAKRYTGFDGVTLQPWISPEGAGLVASTGKLQADETTYAQAERLGRALARAATSLPPNNDVFWQYRATSLGRSGPGPRPALWQALQALAPEHPGLVAPEGVYSTIEGIEPLELRERQRQWQTQELRLALLLSDTISAADRISKAIARWGVPPQRNTNGCPIAQVESALSGTTQVEADTASTGDAAVTMSIRLPSGDGLSSIYAYFLLRLLTAPTGLFEKLGRDTPLTAQFDATIVGGTKRRGLLVAVGTPADKADTVVEALKKLFVDLGNGSAPATLDYAELEAWYREREDGQRSDPRQRLVELWTHASSAPVTSEVSFRTYLRRAFTEGEMMVVRTTPKPEKVQDRPQTGPTPSAPKSRGKAKSAKGP
jgi:hypothetical protein